MPAGRVVTLRAQYTDEQLALAAQRGDAAAADALQRRWEAYAKTVARSYFIQGGSQDDVFQEARIGLMKAVRDWRPDRASFKSFVGLCVQRQVITHVKAASRLKNTQLTEAVRVAVIDDGERVDVLDTLEALRTDPHELLEERDKLRSLVEAIRDRLSPLERESLLGHVFLGETYGETEARIFGLDEVRAPRTPVKVVDNALARARHKLRLALELELPESPPLGAAA